MGGSHGSCHAVNLMSSCDSCDSCGSCGSFEQTGDFTRNLKITLADDDEAVLHHWRTSETGTLEPLADEARGCFKTSEMYVIGP
jgi:hypothetical protein